MKKLFFLLASALLALPPATHVHAAEKVTLLNVSYDVTREFYQEYNPLFIDYWKKTTGEDVVINQSHGGSSKQARSVLDGLEADVVTMNQETDINVLADRGQLIPKKWATRLPDDSAPYTSTIVFLVRKGNPKGIKDWSDLARTGIQIIIPNPKTSGNGRYSYLAAWGFALKKTGSEQGARDFVTGFFKNVPVLDTGGRAATTTFAQRQIGDVLLTFENEVFLIKKEFGEDQFDIIAPSSSILAEAPVSVVDKVVEKHGTRRQAEAYLKYLWSDAAQDLLAKNYFRPRLAAVLQKYPDRFAKIDLFTVGDVFGGWEKAQKTHFDDGGVFDQIFLK